MISLRTIKRQRLFLIVLVSFALKNYGQEQNNRIYNNFIIVINDKIITSVSNPRIIVNGLYKEQGQIGVNYLPGNLSAENLSSKHLILADSVKEFRLLFDVYSYKGENQYIHNYDILLGRFYSKYSFLILKIYDRGNKAYNKRNSLGRGGDYSYYFECNCNFGIPIKK